MQAEKSLKMSVRQLADVDMAKKIKKCFRQHRLTIERLPDVCFLASKNEMPHSFTTRYFFISSLHFVSFTCSRKKNSFCLFLIVNKRRQQNTQTCKIKSLCKIWQQTVSSQINAKLCRIKSALEVENGIQKHESNPILY